MNATQFKPRSSIQKVVLVAPPMKPEQVWGNLADWADFYPPVGLCYLAAYIRKNGYQVSIIDAEVLRYDLAQTVQHIVDEKPDLVGFTCKTLWVNSAHQVAKALKERLPDVPIVAGGHHPTAIPKRTLSEFPYFDILVLGEGEITFLELLQTLNDGKDLAKVKGLAFTIDGQPCLTPPRERIKNLDELPLPAFDLIPPIETHYQSSIYHAVKGTAFPFMTSRGCPHQCTFCDRTVFGNRVTFHSPEYVMSILRDLYDHHQVRYLVIADDNFLLNKKHAYAMLDLLAASGMKIEFSCQSRVDTLDEELLKRLKEAGCTRLMFGIESGSQLILDKMKKGITAGQIKKAIEMTKKAGLITVGYFILGYPGETEATLKETLDLIYKCKFDDIMCWYFAPLPGAEIFENLDQYGTYHEDFEITNATQPDAFVPHGVTAEKLKSYYMDYYNACYMRGYQLRSIPRRIPTMRHLKTIVRSFFVKY